MLRISGLYLDSPALAGATVEIHAEERRLAELEYVPGKPFLFEAALPAELLERPYLNVRLVTDDYVHMGDDLRSTVSLGMHVYDIRADGYVNGYRNSQSGACRQNAFIHQGQFSFEDEPADSPTETHVTVPGFTQGRS